MSTEKLYHNENDFAKKYNDTPNCLETNEDHVKNYEEIVSLSESTGYESLSNPIYISLFIPVNLYLQIKKKLKRCKVEDSNEISLSNKIVYQNIRLDREHQLSFELIRLCQPGNRENKMQINKTAEIFYKMGKIYRERSPDKFSLIRAAALFNAARLRSRNLKETVKQSINELCYHIQGLVDSPNHQDLLSKAKKLKQSIKNMRNKTK